MQRLSVSIWLALCMALPASAQMYKWVDSDGKVQYSDKPPPSNIKTEILRTPAPTASEDKGAVQKGAAKPAPKTAAEQDQAFRKRQQDAAKAQEDEANKRAQARDRAENCKRAKEVLANFEIGGRLTRIDEKGERVYLGDEQIARETAKAREDAAAACN